MLKNVLVKTLRDKRKTFTWWSLGILFITIWYNMMFTAMEGDMSGINQMMESDLVKALLGGAYDLSTPAGWLSAELLPLIGPIIFIVFAVSFASSSLIGEEEKGTLDLLLANPINRTSVFLQKFSSMTVSLLALGLVFWVGNIIGTSSANMELSILSLAEVTFSLFLLGLLFGAFTLSLGALTGKSGLSTGMASAIGVVSYLLDSMAEIVSGLEAFRPVSVFQYYGGGEVLSSGIKFGDVGILLAAALVLVVLGVYGFQRRDIGT